MLSEAVGDRDALVAAYLRERAGLARRGLSDRVALVDAELSRLGHPMSAPPAPYETKAEVPRGRRPKRPTEE